MTSHCHKPPTHHIIKERWALDVGRGLTPWIELGHRGLELVPAVVALGDLGVHLLEHGWEHVLPLHFL